MRQGWWWRALAGGLFGPALAACSFDGSEDAAFVGSRPGDYMLGGQTGSLVPDCGVAPLSAGGIAVPVGNALAVVYGRGCPEELAAEQLAIAGPGERPVTLTLETLGEGVFLVRSEESLPAGQYELGVAGEQNTLSVGAEVSALPMRLGEIVPLASPLACPDDVELELTLGAEALAYAPLLRLLVSVDGGAEQLWVDYGALELEDPESGRAALRLPRCSRSTCLDGRHELRVRAELAGESLSLEPLAVRIDVPCEDGPAAAATASDDAPSDSCALKRSAARTAAWWWCLAGIFWAARRRRH